MLRVRPDLRLALGLLGDCGPEGCSEHVLRAHGLRIEQLVELVSAGLATATPSCIRTGRETIEVATLRIMPAGRQALAR
jgi:hypothetical protein